MKVTKFSPFMIPERWSFRFFASIGSHEMFVGFNFYRIHSLEWALVELRFGKRSYAITSGYGHRRRDGVRVEIVGKNGRLRGFRFTSPVQRY